MTDPREIRVCTWNVHCWCDARGELAFDRAAATLRALRLDVVALQEVPSAGSLDRLGVALDTHSAYAPAGYAGNGLLTRGEPVEVGVVALDVDGAELRSAVRARVALGGVPVTVVATHLDVHHESVRCAQCAILAGAARGDEPALLLGDFNALHMADYDRRRSDEIAARRRCAGLEPPSGALMARLDADGWRDLVRVSAEGARVDGHPDPSGAPLPSALASTSRYETRVDYVFGNDALLARFAVSSALVGDGAASDHRPVVVTLSPRPWPCRDP